MNPDREALVRLRVGLARLAQAVGSPGSIPGKVAPDAPFEELVRVASECEEGWHTLLADLMIQFAGEGEKAGA